MNENVSFSACDDLVYYNLLTKTISVLAEGKLNELKGQKSEIANSNQTDEECF